MVQKKGCKAQPRSREEGEEEEERSRKAQPRPRFPLTVISHPDLNTKFPGLATLSH